MYMGKDLTEVRSLQRPLVPDGVGPGQHEPTFLQAIAIKARADKRHRFQDLYRHLDADFLLACWHDLNQDAASGVDGVTAAEYAGDLHANIQDLVGRLKTKRYRAKRVRRVYIPKENGKERPIGIPALEDKLVQLACAKLLAAIYEQDFLDGSYGYRPGRGALDAVRELTFDLQYGVYGYVVEADVQGFFDNLDHVWLLSMLRLRIDDRAFLGLIRKWLKAGVLDTDGAVIHSDTGTPQGGIVSPVLANVYLHYVLTCGSRRSSRPTVAAKCCCTVTPMIGSAPFAFVTMPSDFIGRCRGGWRNSACRWRRRRPASCASAAFTRA
jgi:RNA-directed DNA polymerase